MKPLTIKGVTSHPGQSALSRKRFPYVQFIHANAVEYVTSLEKGSVDRIFALDCVYHFSSRQKFLEGCANGLRDDGRIVMTDLIFGDNITGFQRLLMRVVCVLTGASYSNFKIQKDYQQDFIRAGFDDISIQDISTDVFPGLQGFIGRHRKEMSIYEIAGSWTAYLVFARVLKWWWETGAVLFVFVQANSMSPSKNHK